MLTNGIPSIDISVFKAPTETTDDDRIALETIRLYLADQGFQYNYLEIGSYLGGSLLPHLISSHCNKILSIDKRASNPQDERCAGGFFYTGITTDHLIEELRRHVENTTCLQKLETYDGVVDDLNAQSIFEKYPSKFHLCFIDAEHTNNAIFSDFLNVYRLVAPDSIIMLHDSWMLTDGIQNIICYLESQSTPFYFCQVRDSVTAFFLGKYSEPGQLPQYIRFPSFDRGNYFQKCKKRLWQIRKEEIIKNLKIDEIAQSLKVGAIIDLFTAQQVINHFSAEEIISHFTAQQVLDHFSSEEIISHFTAQQVLDHFSAEEIISHFTAQQVINYFSAEEIITHFTAQQVLNHFSTEEIISHFTAQQVINYFSAEEIISHFTAQQMINYFSAEEIITHFTAQQVMNHFSAGTMLKAFARKIIARINKW
jgi:cobalamin biosynthesis Co2+ chelatase CbiK